MLPISNILPIGLVAVLLAGCGTPGPVDRAATPLPAPSSTAPSATAPVDRPPGGGDSAPADAPTTIPVTSAAPVADACGLVRPDDIRAVVAGVVDLEFPEPATRTTRVDFLVGTASICRIPLTSQFTSGGGVDRDSGFVTVQVQTAGAADYFPVHGDDTEVRGIGDDALLRHYTLYVRLGAGMLVLTVAIVSASDSANRNAAWERALAPIAIRRL